MNPAVIMLIITISLLCVDWNKLYKEIEKVKKNKRN